MASDPAAMSTGETTAQQLQAYIQAMPGLTQATSASIMPLAQATNNANLATAPSQAKQQADLFAQYGPQLSQVGNDILNRSNLQEAGANTSLLNGAGGQEAIAAQNAQKALDPEYYSTRAAAGNQLNNLLGSINLNGLSGSEAAEVERSNNQQDAARGISNTPSQIATVNNAMNFGSALNTKRNSLEQALSSATSFLPSAQGPTNAFQVATGQPSGNGTSTPTSFGGVQTNTGSGAASGANSMGNNLLSSINNSATTAANINSQRRDTLDRVTGVLGSLPSIS